MRLSRAYSPALAALVLSGALGAGLLSPASVRADPPDVLAAVTVADGAGICGKQTPTFDDVTVSAAAALRPSVPADRLGAYDDQVARFRHDLATLRVHRDMLPVDPNSLGGYAAELDNPIVTYLVNGLDAVRTGRIDRTVPVSQLTVADVIEVFILANRIVKIPAQLAVSLVPTAGFFLKFLVGGVFSGVQWLARRVQDQVRDRCPADAPGNRLDLNDDADFPAEHIDVPAPITDLARQVRAADGACTPIADLTTATVVARTREFLAHSDLPIDRAQLDTAATGVQDFLRDNRIAKAALLRKTEQLGPLVDYMDYGPVTFLTNLGFDIYEGKALDTVALADVNVQNALDLTTLALDVTSLLLTAANGIGSLAGVSSAVLTPLGIAETLAFAPATYGAPILRGVLRSMCTA
ncbi:hypothetical protein [Nocardia nova]|uniref:hypothetical protein n=1 Tax=Nocardia nova TaxID=37330 RepID=UPI0034071331